MRRSFRGRSRMLVAAACAAIVLAGASLTTGGTVETAPDEAWAAQALRVAGEVPRVALGADGWGSRAWTSSTCARAR